MTRIYMTHVDPDQNMARFYTMSLQADLFGEWSLVREWGRIGRGGQVQVNSFPAIETAKSALERILKAKLKGGYSTHAS